MSKQSKDEKRINDELAKIRSVNIVGVFIDKGFSVELKNDRLNAWEILQVLEKVRMDMHDYLRIEEHQKKIEMEKKVADG